MVGCWHCVVCLMCLFHFHLFSLLMWLAYLSNTLSVQRNLLSKPAQYIHCIYTVCGCMCRLHYTYLMLASNVFVLGSMEGTYSISENPVTVLDYGEENAVGIPKSLILTITNTSAIPTSFSASVSHFPASACADLASVSPQTIPSTKPR